MSKVFYDRLGRPHKLKGEATNSSSKPSISSKEPARETRGASKKTRQSPDDTKQKRPSHTRPERSEKRREPERFMGTVDKNKRGSAYLIFDRRDLKDILIPRSYQEGLFHGDRVEVAVSKRGDIEEIEVLSHRFREIYGRIQFISTRSGKSIPILHYERKRAIEQLPITNIETTQAKAGDWVKASVHFPEDGERGGPEAEIIEVFGPDLPASQDVAMVAGEFNLNEHHTEAAEEEARSYTIEVPGSDEEGRTDLRHLPFMTIDGETARDFDDAVYVENLGGQGFRLWVAIADVSHYVRPGTALDSEAYERGTSVYFPERAFHMLPSSLSEELCSLKPGVPRLTMAVSIDYSRDGDIGETELYSAIIQSRRRATYTEIHLEMENGGQHKDLRALYELLKKKRSDRGSLDFDFPEPVIALDEETGEPYGSSIRARNDAHRLIEEFMIAANEAVSEWMINKGLPFIFRIHESPSVEALERFRKLAKTVGVQLGDKGGVPKPKELSTFLSRLQGHEAQDMLSQALLRSLRQAIYSPIHDEHYGLASTGYTHFTSPIRRYPDLVVHRLLRAALENEPLVGPEEEKKLAEITEHCSYRERIAQEAEREANRFKQIRLIKKHLGEIFEGKIVGMTERGMFVQILNPYCEGFLSVEALNDDWYQFNEDRMVMAGRRKKRMFRVGQKMQIQVTRVDLDQRQIEFGMAENKDIEDSDDRSVAPSDRPKPNFKMKSGEGKGAPGGGHREPKENKGPWGKKKGKKKSQGAKSGRRR
jgi:ribonuclease R